MARMSSAKCSCWVLLLVFLTAASQVQGQVINTTDCGDGVNTNWGTWTEWSEVSGCSAQCVSESGEFTRLRSRPCPVDVMGCSDVDQFEREHFSCFGTGTPEDGGYGPWTEWADFDSCNVICGRGKVEQTRTRECDSPPPSCGGAQCRRLGPRTDVRQDTCSSRPCGASCSQYAPAIVRKHVITPGFYLLCHRGSIYRLPCPELSNRKAFLTYGYYNSITIYQVCSRRRY